MLRAAASLADLVLPGPGHLSRLPKRTWQGRGVQKPQPWVTTDACNSRWRMIVHIHNPLVAMSTLKTLSNQCIYCVPIFSFQILLACSKSIVSFLNLCDAWSEWKVVLCAGWWQRNPNAIVRTSICPVAFSDTRLGQTEAKYGKIRHNSQSVKCTETSETWGPHKDYLPSSKWGTPTSIRMCGRLGLSVHVMSAAPEQKSFLDAFLFTCTRNIVFVVQDVASSF